MASKNKKIIETEPVVIEEKAIINEEVEEKDLIEVEAPEVIIENSNEDIKTDELSAEQDAKNEENASNTEQDTKVQLKIEIGFNDKYTSVEYKKGDVVEFEIKRGKELLKDVRNLVSEL